jgi:D-alanyl-D-alanine carboxypeptidase
MGFDLRKLRLAPLILTFGLGLCGTAAATPYLVVDAKTGEVLSQQDATEPWYPASLTKLVSVYVALKAVRDKRLTFDTPFVVSRRAASMPPSKMGFAPGTELTLDNLLKMLLVKSANDLAIVLAEGIDGSVEDFAVEMNATAASLGMKESHFVNPNGLHDPNHYSSARDLAIVARALYRDFPEDAGYFDIGALKLGDQIIPTHNGLMGRYPGIEGMKTGFTCPAGFNIVASAMQGDRQVIAVVLGYPTAKTRELRAASLLNDGFQSRGTGTMLTALPASRVAAPPNMRDQVCGRHRETVAEEDFPIEVAEPGTSQNRAPTEDDVSGHSLAQTATKTISFSQLLSSRRPVFEPLPVFLGPKPGWSGPVLQARATPEAPQDGTVPASAAAYAPTKASLGSGSPVAVDPTALPLNRARRHKSRRHISAGAGTAHAHSGKQTAHASAQADTGTKSVKQQAGGKPVQLHANGHPTSSKTTHAHGSPKTPASHRAAAGNSKSDTPAQ